LANKQYLVHEFLKYFLFLFCFFLYFSLLKNKNIVNDNFLSIFGMPEIIVNYFFTFYRSRGYIILICLSIVFLASGQGNF